MSNLLAGAIGASLATCVLVVILKKYFNRIFDQHTRMLLLIYQLRRENAKLAEENHLLKQGGVRIGIRFTSTLNTK